MKDTVYFYAGNGARIPCVTMAQATINTIAPGYRHATLTAETLREGSWQNDAILLVISGGESKIWRREWGRRGQDIVRHAVRRDGLSLFLECGGAYFGSARTIFNNRSSTPEFIDTSNGLGTFDGVAHGPLTGKYSYTSRAHAQAVRVLWRDSGVVIPVFYHGGCYFAPHQGQSSMPANVTVLAEYVDFDSKPAALGVRYGRGRVVMWGSHISFPPAMVARDDPYVAQFIDRLDAAEPMRRHVMDDSLTYLGLKTVEQFKVA